MSDPLLDAADTVKQALANRIIQDPKRKLQAFLKDGYLSRAGRRGYLAKEILLLIAALCKGGPLTIMSLLRSGKGPHGVPFGGEYLCQAIDIAAYRRKLIKLETNRAFDAYVDPNAPTNTHDGVTGVLSQLPKLPGGLLFGVGMPRTTCNPGGPRRTRDTDCGKLIVATRFPRKRNRKAAPPYADALWPFARNSLDSTSPEDSCPATAFTP
jgi:hypothetical protein